MSVLLTDQAHEVATLKRVFNGFVYVQAPNVDLSVDCSEQEFVQSLSIYAWGVPGDLPTDAVITGFRALNSRGLEQGIDPGEQSVVCAQVISDCGVPSDMRAIQQAIEVAAGMEETPTVFWGDLRMDCPLVNPSASDQPVEWGPSLVAAGSGSLPLVHGLLVGGNFVFKQCVAGLTSAQGLPREFTWDLV